MAPQKNILIGAHLSITNGIWRLKERMNAIKATTCAFFLKNQRRFTYVPLDNESVIKFKKCVKNADILVPHGSYLINMARNEKEIREKHLNCFFDDVHRYARLGVKFYDVHPGSDVDGIGKRALENVADAINQAHKREPDVTILVENMAGQGKVLCSKFNEIRYLIEMVQDKNKVGVCLDTAHLFGGGYDLRTENACEKTFNEFDRIIGHHYLKEMHINDSKVCLGSKKDRHESIGKGKIGMEAFKYIMKNKKFENIPKILKTPDVNLYKEDISLLRNLHWRRMNE